MSEQQEQKKLHCQFCTYEGFKPMLRVHLYMQHGVDIKKDD